MSQTASSQEVVAGLTELIEELLDAHCDTICLEEEEVGGGRWAAHIDYLRDLHRVSQRALAQLTNV